MKKSFQAQLGDNYMVATINGSGNAICKCIDKSVENNSGFSFIQETTSTEATDQDGIS